MRGFTVLELLGSLVVFLMLIIMVNHLVNNMNSQQNSNQMADQIKSYEAVALKYISDNYRNIDEETGMENESGFNTDVIIPWSNLSTYYPQGTLAALTNWQTPCLHLSRNFTNFPGQSTNPFKAYLIFGNANNQAQALSIKAAFRLARTLGGNAGVLVPSGDGFIVEGTNANNQVYSYNWQFGSVCGFSGGQGAIGLLDYSLVIDLTRRDDYVTEARTATDMLSTNPVDDPSLQRAGNMANLTMHTNLYLDNVVQESSSQVIAQHAYRALDFGATPNGAGRIQLISDAQPGVAVTSSRLNINNAGLAANYIAMASHLVAPGADCTATTLGKIAQIRTSFIIGAGSQVQCTYNPVYCGESGYCYLPTKTMAILYNFNTLQSTGMCPIGLLADTTQPDNAIDSNINCPVIAGGWSTTGIDEVPIACNSVADLKFGFTLCAGYATMCNYQNNTGQTMQRAVAALQALQCTNSTTKFVVNNYVAAQ